ncbi:alpha/beta hydrolase [Pseudomonas batumici]|uniref:alpha/beta fold hydrolase n=1 Tax=Pseudomonas batumici TaxID=226910 RepID=UPI0030D00B70
MSSNQSILRVNNVDINVVDVGQGSPTLVFLHYWGGSSRTWAPVITALSKTHRCVAIDFRGWGQSDKDAEVYDLETLADDVAQVIAKLGLTEYVIVGHSMGGKVAQLLASERPEGLKGLVLVAPAPPTALSVPQEQRQGMIAAYQVREGAEAVIGILATQPLSDAHREQVIEDTLCGAAGAKQAWPEVGMVQDITGQASKIAVPVHVIVGGADNIESEASLRQAFAGVIPQAGFVVLGGVGHLAPLEATAELVAAIRSAPSI